MRERICISAGHGKIVRGASCDEDWGLDEVDEARRVVPEVARRLRAWGVEVKEIYDNESTTQSENLEWLVDQHNNEVRDLDVSVHFNAYVVTPESDLPKGRGTEVLYVTQHDLAARVAKTIATAGGLVNRGAHERNDLYFLNNTEEPAILIEVCFVDVEVDCELYENAFGAICDSIARAIK
jgi:N-acetylmuramoyl-L-alanine amidase